jgi:hypothetical protein
MELAADVRAEIVERLQAARKRPTEWVLLTPPGRERLLGLLVISPC